MTVPTMIVHGTAIRSCHSKSQENGQRLRLAVIKGGPHGIATTHAEKVSGLMLDFLRTPRPSPFSSEGGGRRGNPPRDGTWA